MDYIHVCRLLVDEEEIGEREMNLYLLTQDDRVDYDTYDSAVVCASSYTEAASIHPDGSTGSWCQERWRSWASHPELVHVECIGKACDSLRRGVILASFNAG